MNVVVDITMMKIMNVIIIMKKNMNAVVDITMMKNMNAATIMIIPKKLNMQMKA